MANQKSSFHSPESQLVTSASYEFDTKLLRVTLKAGTKLYLHPGVPKEVYIEFLMAESKGTFYNKRIKNQYPENMDPEQYRKGLEALKLWEEYLDRRAQRGKNRGLWDVKDLAERAEALFKK